MHQPVMDSSFERIFGTHIKQHKKRPLQFSSVADGIQKRLEANVKTRKSQRLTCFDKARNLSAASSPAPVLSEYEKKQQLRKQKLEKWKLEKEKKKKEAAKKKIKPFVTGIPHPPMKYVPPPPANPMPSTSGRVTRSQTQQAKPTKQKEAKNCKSFAPVNATFKPPNLKSNSNIPMITFNKPPKAAKVNNLMYKTTTKPISTNKDGKVTTRATRNVNNKTKVTKISPKKQQKITKKVSSKIAEIKTSAIPINEVQPGVNDSENLQHTTPRKSISKASPNFTPRNNMVPKSESSSEERLRSPRDVLQMTPEQFVEEVSKMSPCVTLSRGKANARKEMKMKIKEGLMEDASDMDSVPYFRRQLDTEIARMTLMCDMWDDILEQTSLPDFVQEHILSAVGQARLLMNQKLRQFSTLVDRCAARADGPELVLPSDLRGFWDMLYLQVENVDLRFKKLQELKDRNWVEDVPKKKPKKKQATTEVKKAVKSSVAPSRLKEMIEAARKAKKENIEGTPKPSNTLTPVDKTFDAGFFMVRSPVRSPVCTPNNKGSLLKAVLSNETGKASATKSLASYAMLRASAAAKNIEMEGIVPLEQTPVMSTVDLNATPARSILKPAMQQSVKKSGKKSIKTVLFDEFYDESPVKTAETNTDSGLSSMDAENEQKLDKENKSTKKRREKMKRQENVVESDSPIATRSQRKSAQHTPSVEDDKKTKRSRTKRLLKEVSNVIANDDSVKKASRKKSLVNEVAEVTPRRFSRRLQAINDLAALTTDD